jgi:DNA-binding response OmpR family regulator
MRQSSVFAMSASTDDAPSAVRVLLVEDDVGDAVLTRELLFDAGLQMSLARTMNLADAEAGAVREADCVLLDLGLPDAGGLDAVTRMRDAAPGVAIIVLTGLDDPERRASALAAGAQDYIVKGTVDGDELAAAVGAAIERRRREDASGS